MLHGPGTDNLIRIFNDVIGLTLRDPSSSHFAFAWRIGKIERRFPAMGSSLSAMAILLTISAAGSDGSDGGQEVDPGKTSAIGERPIGVSQRFRKETYHVDWFAA